MGTYILVGWKSFWSLEFSFNLSFFDVLKDCIWDDDAEVWDEVPLDEGQLFFCKFR